MHFLGRRTHFARAIIVRWGSVRNFLAKRKKILEKEEEKEHEDDDEEEEKVCSDARERTRGK
jgi:hypothetical protein|tara:strand:- start:4264 stop:4449 length:186 start_codon:yes stop_codon:yes gene_type:complete